MPIAYDRVAGGYFLEKSSLNTGPRYELPGVWLSESQAYGVLAFTNILMAVAGPILEPTLRPLRILTKDSIGLPTDSPPPVWDRVSIEIPGIGDATARVLTTVSIAMYSSVLVQLITGDTAKQRLLCSLQRFALTGSGWHVDAYLERIGKVLRIPIGEIKKATVVKSSATRLKWTNTHWENSDGQIVPAEQLIAG
jgi:hypothetical protein